MFHRCCWSSSTFQLWSVCFDKVYLSLKISRSSSHVPNCISVSANNAKRVFSSSPNDGKSVLITQSPPRSFTQTSYGNQSLVVMDRTWRMWFFSVLTNIPCHLMISDAWISGRENNSNKPDLFENSSQRKRTISAILWEHAGQEEDIEAAIILRAEKLHNSIRT